MRAESGRAAWKLAADLGSKDSAIEIDDVSVGRAETADTAEEEGSGDADKQGPEDAAANGMEDPSTAGVAIVSGGTAVEGVQTTEGTTTGEGNTEGAGKGATEGAAAEGATEGTTEGAAAEGTTEGTSDGTTALEEGDIVPTEESTKGDASPAAVGEVETEKEAVMGAGKLDDESHDDTMKDPETPATGGVNATPTDVKPTGGVDATPTDGADTGTSNGAASGEQAAVAGTDAAGEAEKPDSDGESPETRRSPEVTNILQSLLYI